MNSKKVEKQEKKYYLFKMNLKTLNILSIILLIVMLGIGYLFYHDIFKDIMNVEVNVGVFLLLFMLYTIFHEILHSISYVINGAKFKRITYGVYLEKNILCCLCKQNITKKNILISLMYPLFFIGIVTFIVGAVFKLPILYILSIVNISGCIGDIIMFNFIVRLDKSIKFSEFDDPTAFAIYSDKNLSKMKPFGLEYIGSETKLKQDDLKKVRVSKESIFFIVVLVLMAIFMLIPNFVG